MIIRTVGELIKDQDVSSIGVSCCLSLAACVTCGTTTSRQSRYRPPLERYSTARSHRRQPA